MVYCAAVSSTSNSASAPPRVGSFDSSQSDPKQRNELVVLIKCKHYRWQSTHGVCSLHFVETDFHYVISKPLLYILIYILSCLQSLNILC